MLDCYNIHLTQYIDSKPYVFASLLDINIKGCVYSREERVQKREMLLTAVITEHIAHVRGPVPQPQVARTSTTLPGTTEANFLQNLLTQHEPDVVEVENSVQDAQLEAQREIAAFRADPQDATLSTNAREYASPSFLCSQVPPISSGG